MIAFLITMPSLYVVLYSGGTEFKMIWILLQSKDICHVDVQVTG